MGGLGFWLCGCDSALAVSGAALVVYGGATLTKALVVSYLLSVSVICDVTFFGI